MFKVVEQVKEPCSSSTE